MSERAELIIDTVDIDDDNILFLTPNHIRGVKYCASNIFDYATIKNCPTEKLNSGSLIGVFNSLKPGAEVYIVVNQPISVMLEYDSKQIEANLRLVGFEDIKYEETADKKNGTGLLIGTLTATKPVNKEKDIQFEIINTANQYSYRNKSEKKRDIAKDRDDRGGYRLQKRVIEEVREEPSSSRYSKKTKYGNTSFNAEKKEKEEINPKKYNRFARKEEEEPKSDVYQREVVVTEERRGRPKRYGYSKAEVKEEKPQIIETKKEVIETRGRRPGEVTTTTKEVVVQKTTVVDKNAELENKKAGLRRRYGKH